MSLVLASLPLTARAQSGDTGDAPPPSMAGGDKAKTDEAAARYKRGLELYSEDNYKGALLEFRKAYELTNSYKVLYNIGQVCYQLQDYVCALESFEVYLKRGKLELSEKRQDEVEAEIMKLRPRISDVTIITNVPDVDITVDDIPRGKTPLPGAIRLSAGSHRIVAIKGGKIPVTRSIDVAGAEAPTIKFDLVDAGGGNVIVQGERSKWTTLSYVGLGLGGALAVSAGITGVLALSASNTLKEKQYVGAPSSDATSTQSRVKTLRVTSDILSAAAIVTIGTTLVLTLTRKTDEQAPPPKTGSVRPVDIGVSVGFGYVSLQGAF